MILKSKIFVSRHFSSVEKNSISSILKTIGKAVCHKTTTGKWDILTTSDTRKELQIEIEVKDLLYKLLSFRDNLKHQFESKNSVPPKEIKKTKGENQQNYLQYLHDSLSLNLCHSAI